MTGTTALRSLHFELREHGPGPVLEFVAFLFPPEGAFVVGWPSAPGEVRHDPEGRPVLLHFAPARWLVPAPSPDIAALLEAAVASGAGPRSMPAASGTNSGCPVPMPHGLSA